MAQPGRYALHAGIDDDGHQPPRFGRFLGGLVWTPTASVLVQAGEMLELLIEMVIAGVRHPLGIWVDVREQMYETLRSSWLTLVFSTFVFGFSAPGLQGASSLRLLGMPDRLGSFFVMSGVREFTPWINAIVIGGVVGTRLTADLGSRRIREEFDAMEVMGIDPVHDVLLPRVVGLTVMTGLLSLVSLVFGVAAGVAAAVFAGSSAAGFLDQFWNSISTVDLGASLFKALAFGLVISLVCGYKGYRADGGPTGVGRAVNQGVVAAFAGVWVVNLLISSLLLGLNPSLTEAH
jgi:phospholipid/cholesterol/gamma-HCH transport system permease protein